MYCILSCPTQKFESCLANSLPLVNYFGPEPHMAVDLKENSGNSIIGLYFN